ncbi:MAG: glycoside hydrolase family 88 protein [Prevotellaceae bacterium]|jgi:unsaturated rhamnogalacturonyl hydrolase|nr:glycoside hydrolase family 88 protein [Prevotellaceae bacterium]
MKTRKIYRVALFFMILSPCTFSAEFRTDSLYSKWIIDSRMGDFRNKSEENRFLTGTTTRNVAWDYVPGLVAKAILMAWEQYKDEAWSACFFTGIRDYADHVEMKPEESNIDDLNAGKIFFELYRGALAKGDVENASIYKEKATVCRNMLKNNHRRIRAPLPGAGGFWHKKQYVNQMWLDGLYMGAALYAEWQGNFGMDLGEKDNNDSWNDVALQFDTVFNYTWDAEKKLNYHAWSAEPSNSASKHWANPSTGRSAEFWARGLGWFFAALVDVLEYMPAEHPARERLVGYARKVADGLKERQDAATGCWYQLLQYDGRKKGNPCGIYNYLESSASAMFTYAYLKGMRLGVLDGKRYAALAEKAYTGLIENFVVEENDGKIKLIQSCESAGLSASRKGDADYYLCGGDVAIHNDTEGKALGPFIMASLEYEKRREKISATDATEKKKCRFMKFF